MSGEHFTGGVEYARILEPLAAARAQLSELSRRGPTPGSPAAREGRTRVGRLAWILAVSAASIGVDHLAAWQAVRVAASLQPIFAHLTLIRGAVEGCAVARWLADTSVSSTVRMQRAAGAQLADYEERIRFERRLWSRLPKPRRKGRTGEQRRQDLEERLRHLGIKPIPLPSTTDLFARYFLPEDPEESSGEAFFRQISAVAHSKVWSILAISDIGEVVDHGRGLNAANVAANEQTALLATASAMQLATEAVADVARYSAAARAGTPVAKDR